ncbi:MAG: type II/III secretion system protein [Alcanivorax sp.]|nr:type II/III secretion system protein [Alcanivorax sp.]MBU59384.1 type II/III secretion system protein [Alcanivorax sp.]UWN50336.1 Type II secretion system protein D [Alcanivorax sp. ALC70]HCE40700.1 type II/III secretion system protein [Alcanivorax sp.]|tara:strand:- start:109803 stop:111113 length:1311 start_codon:yes stop_codon:yes gene_type:complete
MRSSIVLVLLAASLWASTATAATRYMDLYAGEARTFSMGTITRVAVGSPSVLNYKVLDDGSLLLIGVAEGVSNVSVWKRGGRKDTLEVTVSSLPVDRQLSVSKKLANLFQGLEVEQVGKYVVFKGRVEPQFIDIIKELTDEMPNSINMVRGDGFEVSEMVRMDVKIVEIGRQDLQRLGIRWDDQIGGPAYGVHSAATTNPIFGVYSSAENELPGQISEALENANFNFDSYDTLQYFGITTGIGSTIEALAEVGDARILSAPRLVARSGEEAEFRSGGDYPIPVINQDGFIDVTFREYGIILNILPVVSGDDIKASVEAEVSNIDLSTQVNGVPGVLVRRALTTINVKDQDTIVISGLVSGNLAKQTQKVPFLGDIPILGKLFSSTEDRIDESEVLIMVTPRIVDAQEESNQKLVERVRGEVESIRKDMEIDALLME